MQACPWAVGRFDVRHTMYDRILVAVDGSPTADRAMSEAIQLASKLGAELVIAHVIDNAYLKYDVGYIVSGLLRASLRTVAARVRTAPTSDSKAARPRSRQRFALLAGA
ncbi:universal stress protein [Ralstonia pseudosolanacearum]|uniref:universal stress protein n=1 Tax=Ralstonia pseudosolanacearum TaxID=1310165 RepID=UPI0035E4290D